MKKLILTLCFICLLTLPLTSCSIEKVKAQDGVKPEYTVMKEEDFPDKVKELIEENKESEFQLTYQDGSYLYLLKGYGNKRQEDTVSKLRTCPCGTMPSIYRPP